MKIETNIKYQEEYLPSRRHRIPRIREVEEPVTLELREVNKEDAPIAMVVTDYKSFLDENGQDRFGLQDTAYVAVDNQLFSEKRDTRGALDVGAYSLTEFINGVARQGDCTRSWNGKTKEDMLRSLNKFMDSHMLIDGVIYEQKNEPRYVINTFGLGHNHGSTGMFIETYYNPNISKNSYFNALQRDEAIAYANKVAEARGDTNSIGTFGDINIQVLMPEMVRCDPNMEHGNGNPFLNTIEELVQTSNNSFEAGLLVMSAATAPISDNKPSLDDQIQSINNHSHELRSEENERSKSSIER